MRNFVLLRFKAIHCFELNLLQCCWLSKTGRSGFQFTLLETSWNQLHCRASNSSLLAVMIRQMLGCRSILRTRLSDITMGIMLWYRYVRRCDTSVIILLHFPSFLISIRYLQWSQTATLTCGSMMCPFNMPLLSSSFLCVARIQSNHIADVWLTMLHADVTNTNSTFAFHYSCGTKLFFFFAKH